MKTLFLAVILTSVFASAQVTIGYIGDSITNGYTSSPQVYPGTIAATDLNTYTGTSNYSAVNQGVNGTDSGNWVSGSSYLNAALAAFSAAHVNSVSIMLGTNDAGYSVSSSTYLSNMQSLVAALEAAGYTTITVNYSPYMAANPFGFNPTTANALLLQYEADLQIIAAADSHVHVGDTTAWTFFQANQSLLSDGLHPDNAGYASLGQFWASALERSFVSATRCVGSTVGTACEFSYSDVQSAWNAANYGDTIVVAHTYVTSGTADCLTLGGKANYNGTPITITTDVPGWLPAANTRITLSDEPNMPTLVCGGNQPISLYRDPTNGPVQGLTLVGLHIQCNDDYSTCGPIIWTNNYYLGAGHPGAATDLPNNIVIDRCIIDQPFDDRTSVPNAIELETRAATVKNSWLYSWTNSGQEAHAILAIDAQGPWTITNNMMVITSSSAFTGGSNPDIAGLNPSGTMRYNYIYRPFKWWRESENPNAAWAAYEYAHNNGGGAGGGTGCFKNQMELKKVNGFVFQYNVSENMWGGQYCGSQSFSVTANAKTNTPCSYNNCQGTATAPTTTTFAWTGNLCSEGYSPCILQAGWLFCIAFSDAYNCQTIATVNNATGTGTIVGTWPMTSSTGSDFLYATDPTATYSNVTVDSNLFRNIYGGPEVLGADSAYGPSNGGLMVNFAYTNNLHYQTIALQGDPNYPPLGNQPFKFYPAQTGFGSYSPGGQNITFAHNTFSYCCGNDPTYNWLTAQTQTPVLGSMGGQSQAIGVTVANNLMAPALSSYGPLQSSGACSSMNNYGPCLSFLFDSTSKWVNNTIQGASFTGCGAGQTCTGNFTGIYDPQFISPNSYQLSSSSPYSKGATDGTDLGADPETIPQINNLHVITSSRTALLEFDLTAASQDAGNTQPCVLEVSDTMFNGFPALASYLSAYTTTSDLNPAFFKQATASNRSNPLLLSIVVNGGHVAWPIGQKATVTGDDGSPHNLALASATQYWGRLMCYGDTQHFSFTTPGSASGATSFTMEFTPPFGVTTVQVNYGATEALGSSVAGAVGPGGTATIIIPAIGGDPLYTRASYLDSGGNVVYLGVVRLQIP